ncbi:MAG: AAA family ATPase, partial [Synechococcus sp. MOX_bin73]|nr:AAA family ATPase [Synechococcus sp. MOX_bin73]
MPKSTAIFVCQACGAKARQFFGRCPECGSWNSLVEQSQPSTDGRRRRAAPNQEGAPSPRRSTAMASLDDQPLQRLLTGSTEFDRVLGSGLVPGSLVLVGGDPGIGKSTLLLQSASAMAAHSSVLYVSAEESAQQVKLRWQRLAGETSDLQLLAETDLELVLEELEALRPAVAIIDSIQALHDPNLTSAPGSVGQVRECAASLQRLAKRQNTALLLVGHVT